MIRRLPALLVAATFGAATFAAAPVAQEGGDVVAYENGLWYDGEGFVEGTRYVRGERFVEEPAAGPDDTVDLGGGYVVPPFGEAHTHLIEADAIEAYVQHYLERGVFYARCMSSSPWLRERIVPSLNRPDSIDYVSANQGFTGPGGHPLQIIAQAQELGWLPREWTAEDIDGKALFVLDSPADIDRCWERFLEGGPDFVKLFLHYSEEHEARRGDPAYDYRRGLDPRLAAPLVERAHAAGLVVFAHAFTVHDVRTALAAGVDHLAHMPGLGWEPELGDDPFLLADEDVARIAAAGMTVTTTICDLFETDGSEDASLRGYLEDVLRPNLDRLREAGVPLLLGTDKPRATTDVEAATLLRLGLMEPAELLRAWSVTTPRNVFPGRDLGRLAPGAEASFLVLEGDPLEDFENTARIVLRVKQGRELQLEPVPFPPFPGGR